MKRELHSILELKIRWFALANHNNKVIYLTGGSDYSSKTPVLG